MLELKKISKSFQGPEGKIQALADVSFSVKESQFIAVHGPSGCGKTTLLLIAGGLLEPDSGEVLIDNLNPYQLSANQRSVLRSDKIGFVFQQFHLVPYLSVLDNILIPSIASDISSGSENKSENILERAKKLIRQFKLEHRANHVPEQLSVGEQQRTSLARAMLNNPEIILADEPTGNLDRENRDIVLTSLVDFAKKGGIVLIVTHDTEIAQYADKYIEMCQGKIVNVTNPGIREPAEKINKQ